MRVYRGSFCIAPLNLESVFSSFKGFTEPSFQDREHGFNLIPLMIFFVVENLSDTFSIVSGNPFPFSVSDWDKRT